MTRRRMNHQINLKKKDRLIGNTIFEIISLSFGGQCEGDDQTVETKYFGENQDQNHTDEQSRLLCGTSYTSIADDTNRKTGRQTRQTNRQTGAQM